MADERAFDIVLFGATGFTGGLVAQYLAQTTQPLRWAIAGRNRDKLEQVRAQLPRPPNGQTPELILADATDRASLRAMVPRTRVLITTVGPYIEYGEPLVAACAELGTDYVDLTGEAEFVDLMTQRYHAQAASHRTRIVHSCGFDSIPHDLGAYFTLQALRRRMSVEQQRTTPVTIEGLVHLEAAVSGGTWQSIVISMSRLRHYKPTPPPATTEDGRRVGLAKLRGGYRKQAGLWAVPMPSIDPIMVCHSARLIPEYGPDFRYGHYAGFKHLAQVIGLTLGAIAVLVLAQFAATRGWLLSLKASGDGPDAATREKNWFRVLFEASAGAQRVSAAVGGGDPFYGETAKMLAESALCLVFDRERLPVRYGILPPAAALGDALIERLRRAGITFEELGSALPSDTAAL